MYRIKNTAEDRTKHLSHRTASKFELEPNLGGIRIRLGTHLDITDEHYDRVKPTIDEWVKKGMVDAFRLDTGGSAERKLAKEFSYNDNGLKLEGPTLEEWVNSGYPADTYPPSDFAEVPSPGLTAFRMEQDRAKNEIPQILPVVPIQEPEVLPEPVTIVNPEPPPTPIPAPVMVQAPPPPSNKGQDPNKNKKLR